MKKCTEPNATHYAGCECHEAAHANGINRLKCELTKAHETITDLRNEAAALKNKIRADRQIDAGHAMYRGGLMDRLSRLEAAAKAVIDRWDTPLWKDAEPTANVINELRKTLNP